MVIPRGKIFIIFGPSGSGEDSVIEGLRRDLEIERVITTTTRRMRRGESEGSPYHFISKKEFQEKLKRGEFVEFAEGYNGHHYGVTEEELNRVLRSGKIGIWKVEYQGVRTIKKKFPYLVAIYLAPSSIEILEGRIRKRGDIEDRDIGERMAYTRKWMKEEKIYDEKVINEEGKLEETIIQVKTIIERCLRSRHHRFPILVFLAIFLVILLSLFFVSVFPKGLLFKKIVQGFASIEKIQSKELLEFVPSSAAAYFFKEIPSSWTSDLESLKANNAIFFVERSSREEDHIKRGMVVVTASSSEKNRKRWGSTVLNASAIRFPVTRRKILPDGTEIDEIFPSPEDLMEEHRAIQGIEATILRFGDPSSSNQKEDHLAYAFLKQYFLLTNSESLLEASLLAKRSSDHRLDLRELRRCETDFPSGYALFKDDTDLSFLNESLHLERWTCG